MSDDYVHVIPDEPGLVPDDDSRQNAVAYFRSIAPKAGEITVSVSDYVEFVHCGQNFERIPCPSCGAVIELSRWRGWMNEDFQGKGKGFLLTKRAPLPRQ